MGRLLPALLLVACCAGRAPTSPQAPTTYECDGTLVVNSLGVVELDCADFFGVCDDDGVRVGCRRNPPGPGCDVLYGCGIPLLDRGVEMSREDCRRELAEAESVCMGQCFAQVADCSRAGFDACLDIGCPASRDFFNETSPSSATSDDDAEGSGCGEPTRPRPSPACCSICTTGKACGDSCIARERECSEPVGCACDG